MGNMIETLTKEEQAIFIVALFLLLFAIVMSYAMVQDYRIYLDENYKARYSFCDFIKRELYLSVSRTDFRHHPGIYSIYNGNERIYVRK